MSGYANLIWRHAQGEGREWSLQAHHTFHQNEEEILPPLNGDYRTTGSGIQFSYLNQAAVDFRTNLAGEYRLNRLKLPALLGNDGYVEDNIFRVSGAAEWNPSPTWVLHAAAMLEHHSDADKFYLSPRLALNWLPSSAHAFRLGASRGLSALGLYANNTDIRWGNNQLMLSTRKLDAEKINSVEIGYLFDKPQWNLNLDVRAFHNRIHDIVGVQKIAFPDSDGKTLTYRNETEATQQGLEYQLKWRTSPHGWLSLSQSWISRDSDNGENFRESIPRQTFSLLVSQPLAGVDVSLGYYRIGETFWIGGDRDKKSKYNRLDLRLAKAWKTADGKIQAALVIQSLLGHEFESFNNSFRASQEFERRGYLSLKYEFR